MTWNNTPDNIEDYFGFIYEIENLVTGKKYIGRKHFWRIEKKLPLKGKKNKRHFKKETDWKDYCGSCNELMKDIEKYGKINFKRKIIKLCKTKWECAYYEAKEQFDRDVLLRDDYYNGIINLRIPARKNKNV